MSPNHLCTLPSPRCAAYSILQPTTNHPDMKGPNQNLAIGVNKKILIRGSFGGKLGIGNSSGLTLTWHLVERWEDALTQ